jgi:hypothetical protein
MNKKMNNAKESVTISFPFEIYNNGEFIDNAILERTFDENELKALAEILEKHGGYAVDMCDLEDFYEELTETANYDELDELYPDEEDFSGYRSYLCDEMPSDLIEAVDKYVKFKDVDQDFYLDVDGEEVKSSFLLRISNDAFNKMKQIVAGDPYDKSDYEMLKEKAPEAYEEIANKVSEWASEYCMKIYNSEKPCTLKNFPYQVFENM